MPGNVSSRSRCRYSFDGQECGGAGDHLCGPRAARAVAFFEELLPHTKGRWARQPFKLADWQRDEMTVPLFGQVVWDPEWGLYRRQYRIAWVEIARKNGKSEWDAGVALLLTCGDDEEGAEVYGCAQDRDQARKVFDVAERMVALSPTLSKRLTTKSYAKRIIDERTGSYYEVIASDAAGNLGHNPHGIIFDEVLTQKDGALWHALRTAMGARVQPLMVGTTTAGNDPASFAASQHDEMERVDKDPQRAPHVLTFMRNTPRDADPWDETNWAYANPALGDFLSISALRDEATEARADPAKENAFRQFRLNQWVSQVTRWMPLHLWDACTQRLVTEDQLAGRLCYGGLDLAATTDLAALAWLFPDAENPDGMMDVLWRAWVPEAQLPMLDRHTGGKASVWAREGLLTATPGDWIDYDAITSQIDADARAFDVATVGYDPWNATATVQGMQAGGLDVIEVRQGFRTMSPAMKELMRLVKMQAINTGGNPVARWNADSVEAKQDAAENIKPIKPERQASGKRIDLIVALVNAIFCWQLGRGEVLPEAAVF